MKNDEHDSTVNPLQKLLKVFLKKYLTISKSSILSSLGVPVSNAINMFYKQIILQRGLPFDVKLPQRVPVSMAALSDEELDKEIDKGYQEMLSGDVDPADDVFAEINKRYRL